MGNNIEPRKDFYADEMNYDRMENELEKVVGNLTLAEVLKMVREISYDMVRYDDNFKGVIYNGNYTENGQYQACRLQRLLSAACDLFGQSVINRRVFEDGYLKKWLDGGAMELEIENLKERINQLEEELEYERSKKNDTK